MLTHSFQRNHGTPIEQVATKGYDLQFGTIVVIIPREFHNLTLSSDIFISQHY